MEAHTPADIARADDELAFSSFAAFNDRHLGVFRVTGSPGAAPWEMHPDTDELLHVLEGSVTVEVYGPDGNETVDLTAGQLVVVPRGRWHRHVDAVDLVEMFYTPGESLHTDDPATMPLETMGSDPNDSTGNAGVRPQRLQRLRISRLRSG